MSSLEKHFIELVEEAPNFKDGPYLSLAKQMVVNDAVIKSTASCVESFLLV